MNAPQPTEYLTLIWVNFLQQFWNRRSDAEQVALSAGDFVDG